MSFEELKQLNKALISSPYQRIAVVSTLPSTFQEGTLYFLANPDEKEILNLQAYSATETFLLSEDDTYNLLDLLTDLELLPNKEETEKTYDLTVKSEEASKLIQRLNSTAPGVLLGKKNIKNYSITKSNNTVNV